jgi:SAM-dependent methyltransferase
MDLDEYRTQSLQTWKDIAPGWEDRREWMWRLTESIGQWMVDRVDPQPGDTVLELAGGIGDSGFIAARRLGNEGRLVQTDFSPEMSEAARRNGERLGVSNVDYRVLDAEDMDLADDSVDGVICRWGFMLMADPAAALRETRRVLRDGGRLAFVVWRTPDLNMWAAIPGMTLVQRGHLPPPEPGAPGIFALGDADRVRELVTGAGFGKHEIQELGFDFRYADEEDYWDALVRLAGPLAVLIKELDEDERNATRETIAQQTEQYRQDDGSYVIPGSSWGVVAS